MEEPNNNLSDEIISGLPKKPTQTLKVLCILTFIWSGISVLQNLSYALFLETIKEVFLAFKFPESYNEVKQGIMKLIGAGRLFFFFGLLMNISSIIGAYMMLKLNKKGFHFYTISQIILLMLPMIFIKGSGFPFGEFIISALFVAMYAQQIKISTAN